MSPSDIATAPRWLPLGRFVERWYVEPLGAREGISESDLRSAEERLGRVLPAALREWFALVGDRFCDVNQDRPQRLHELIVRGDRIPLWWENQGNWSLDLELGADGEEPWCSVECPEPAWNRREPLARALLGMVYSDTLIGASAGDRAGPLGKLRPGVVGGFWDAGSAESVARVAALPALDVMTNPYFAVPYRGHDALVIRTHGDGMWDWMARTSEAQAEAAAILGVEIRTG